MPPCMQTSVAPSRHASSARSATCSTRQPVRVGVALPLGERAEPAADVADVGEVDVPVDHVGDVVADGVAAHVVGEPAQLVQRRRRRRRTAPAPPPRARGASSAAGSSAASRSPASDVVVDAGRRGRGAGRPAWRGHLGPVAVDRVEVAAPVAGAAGGVDRARAGRCGRPARTPSSGSCHGRPDRHAPLDRQAGRRVGQRRHVRGQPRVEPRLAARGRTPGRSSAARAA